MCAWFVKRTFVAYCCGFSSYLGHFCGSNRDIYILFPPAIVEAAIIKIVTLHFPYRVAKCL